MYMYNYIYTHLFAAIDVHTGQADRNTCSFQPFFSATPALWPTRRWGGSPPCALSGGRGARRPENGPCRPAMGRPAGHGYYELTAVIQ